MKPDLAASLRQAISHEDYPRALEIWSSYASDLRDAVTRGELTRAEMANSGDLFEWCFAAVRAARSHLQVQLNMTHSAAAYLTRAGGDE
jgi:hypothetical protein